MEIYANARIADSGDDDEKMEAAVSEKGGEEQMTQEEVDSQPRLSSVERAMLIGFLNGLLDRLKLLSLLPGAKDVGDTSIRMSQIADGYEIIREKLLESAQLMLRPLRHGPKVSKFEMEVLWLQKVFLATLNEEIKELKKQSKVDGKYRADIAVATADCARRGRDLCLKTLKEEVQQLRSQIEVENGVNAKCVEFLKKQNLQLMEEAITLAAGHDNDVQYMDIMLGKLKDQMQRKQELLSVLEPRYKQEMAEKEAAKAELARQRDISIEMQGEMEMRLRATIKIQKIWRGHVARVAFHKESKKLRKKKQKESKRAGKKLKGKK
ncbi:hypothetical protein O6H91_13G039400 [Diphasiastrum complanatum]|uniref:Uncharacterized protein n=1 Tax=Diphasiastrum complanatum TaxID=34168 RepID=A0ACC2BTY8_DIPCM|nr:hypothetical protein O6H91_13G039400 [Diphasiastrum complanatum]